MEEEEMAWWSSSSLPWNIQQVARQQSKLLYDVNRAHELQHTSILDRSTFRSFFSLCHNPTIDIVVFFEKETNSPYGFGFVANEKSNLTGGTFRTQADTSFRLRKAWFSVAQVLRIIHMRLDSQRQDLGKEKLVNYIQFPIPSLLLEHQFSNYFNNFPPCHFSVVTLSKNRPCGFGFLQIPPIDTLRFSVEANYRDQFQGMVEQLKMIIADGITAISGISLGQGVTRSRMTRSVQQQQQQHRGERGRGSATTEVAETSGSFLGHEVMGRRMTNTVEQQQQQQWCESGAGYAASEEIFNAALNTYCFQPTAEVITHYPDFNTPSGAHSWRGSQTAPSYAFEWTGSRNVAGHSYAVMEQHPQSFLHYQPTAWVNSCAAINTPISEPLWSGTSAGLMGQVLSGRLAGQPETSQWPGSRYTGGYSNTVMQQQPEPSIHSQTAAWPICYSATDARPSSSVAATGQIFSGSLDGGQPTTSEWSRVVGSNRRAQNRDACAHPPPNPSAGNSAIFPNEWNMWK